MIDLTTMMRRHMAKRVIAPPAVKNWNRELQELLDTDPSEQKYLKLRELAHDFNLTAEVYAKILISELFVPANEKTIPPSSIGGFAGGQKFICQGILFKFAVDVQLPDSDCWMYGKHAPDNIGAMKAAASELRHIVALSNAVGDTDLRVPLMALIDYRGFRLVASSLLPISSHTIVYGSDNAGFNVYAQPDVAAKFDLVAKRINLKKHNFGNVEIAGPVDIEIHKGEDDRLYVIDVARLMPPEAPELSITPHERSNYFMLLRPCLVFKYAYPLSSDAYTGFGRDGEDIHNAEVWRATKFLQTVLVPEMGRQLVLGRYRVHGRHLCQVLHKTGINLRYLGLLRYHMRLFQSATAEEARTPVTAIPGRADSTQSGTSIYSGHSNHSASNADLNALLGLPPNTPAHITAAIAKMQANESNGTSSGPASPTGASPASPPSNGVTFEKGLKQSVSSNSLSVSKGATNRSASGPVTELEPAPTPKRRAGTRSQGGGKTRTPGAETPKSEQSKSEQSTPSPVFSPLSPISKTVKEQNAISKSNDTLSASIDSNGKKRNPLSDFDFSPNSSSERLHKGFFKKTHTATDQTSSEESSRASLTASRASDSQRTPELARKHGPNSTADATDPDVLPSELSVLRDLDNSASLLILQPDRSGTTETFENI